MVMLVAQSVEKLLADGYEMYRLGSQGHLLSPEHRRRIREAIRAKPADMEVVELCDWLAAISLAAHDRPSAAQAFTDGGILDREGNIVASRVSAVESWKNCPHVAGLLRLNLSRFLEQEGHRDKAEAHAHPAVRHLEKAANHPRLPEQIRDYAFLLGCEARLHLARLAFVLGRQPEGEAMVGEVREDLLERFSRVADAESLEWHGGERTDPSEPERATLGHGLKAMLACAMSLRAYFDWTTGKFELGRRRAFQALHLLDAPVAHDLARAITLFTASRIEAMGATMGADLQVHLLRQAGALYHAHQHPMKWQTRVQIAQCLVKAGKFGRAEVQLDAIENAMHEASGVDGRIIDDAKGDIELARLWLDESQRRWASARSRAANLAESVSPRLHIEGLLHEGIATAELGGDLKVAMELVTRALREADDSRRARIALRAHLALAEYHPEEGIARAHFRKAGAMLTQHRGPVLRSIYKRLAERFLFTTIEVRLDQSLNAAIEELQERYDEVIVGDGDDVARVMMLSQQSQANAYRTMSDAGRRRKKR